MWQVTDFVGAPRQMTYCILTETLCNEKSIHRHGELFTGIES
jgi:hypothetical protein